MDRTYDPPLCAAAMQTPPTAADPLLAFLGVPDGWIQSGESIEDACGVDRAEMFLLKSH